MHELMILCNYINVLENCNKKKCRIVCPFFPLYGVPIAVKTITDVIPKFQFSKIQNIFKIYRRDVQYPYIYIRTWLRILK